MIYKAYFDGSCFPNPGGVMGFGAVIYVLEHNNQREIKRLSQRYSAKSTNSNNVAEYQSFGWILLQLEQLIQNGDVVEIIGDSKLVVNQMNVKWEIKRGNYVQYALKALTIVRRLRQISKIDIKWVPREDNSFCDKLSKDCLKV